MTAPGVTPAPLPSGMTLDQWIADGKALIATLDQFLPLDAQAIVGLAADLLAAGAKALEAPSPATILQTEIDAEQTEIAAQADAKFKGQP